MLLNLNEVSERFRVKPNTILLWVANGDFPKPIRIGRRTLRWREVDIEAFIESLIAKSAQETAME